MHRWQENINHSTHAQGFRKQLQKYCYSSLGFTQFKHTHSMGLEKASKDTHIIVIIDDEEHTANKTHLHYSDNLGQCRIAFSPSSSTNGLFVKMLLLSLTAL